MIGFCPLASGSRGNSLYLGTKKTKILIDVGLSYKEISARLEKIGVKMDEISAILITHEHLDHIEGLKTLVGKKEIPVLTNSETAKGICKSLQINPKFKIFSTDETFEYEDLVIHPFSIQHDTLDPVAFVIQTEQIKIGICTDLGLVTSLVKMNLQGCDYLYIEANHDVNTLFSSKRPEALKKRISGRQGHLSNQEALHLIASVLHPDLKHIYLAHLSSECNNPELTKQIVEEFLKSKSSKAKISIAYQEQISDPLFF
jgi:phosphoribosyl 1,2-cyclic phosphodiesterase